MRSFNGDFPPWRCSGRQRKRGERRSHPLGNKPWKKELHHQDEPWIKSFDGLNDEKEKDIFLDVCCFFIGKDIAYVTEILNGCGLHSDCGIPVLIDRSLIKVEKNNKLGMHNLVQEMGREIIRQSSRKKPGKRSRLWFNVEVVDVLTKNTVSTFLFTV